MQKIFSVSSWNVEHFKDESQRVKKVADFINGLNGGPQNVPDVFALYEVEGKDIYQEFMTTFPDHRFHLTEGKQTQEIFIGVHRNFQTFSTQRLEFKTGKDYLRPGLLLTIHANNSHYPILFLHIKSGSNTEDFGLRDTALINAFNLKKALDKAVGGKSNFIFMGDMNTMGIDDPVPYSKIMDISSGQEIERIGKWAKRRKMLLLSKDKTLIDGIEQEVSWYNGSKNYKPTNLDHVVVSDQMKIRDQAGNMGNISVLGWPKLPEADRDEWFIKYSDHGMLYFEVWDE